MLHNAARSSPCCLFQALPVFRCRYDVFDGILLALWIRVAWLLSQRLHFILPCGSFLPHHFISLQNKTTKSLNAEKRHTCGDMNIFDDHQSTLWTSSQEDPESQIVGSYNRNTCEASCRIKVGPHWYRVLDTIVHCLSVHVDCIRPSTVVIWKPIIF